MEDCTKLFVMICTKFFTKCQNKVAKNLVTSEICVTSKQASISSKHQKEALADVFCCMWEALAVFYKKNYEFYKMNLIGRAGQELSQAER